MPVPEGEILAFACEGKRLQLVRKMKTPRDIMKLLRIATDNDQIRTVRGLALRKILNEDSVIPLLGKLDDKAFMEILRNLLTDGRPAP